MDYTSFAKDAAHKRRSVKDLARFISTRTDNNPNYSLLFGAGCSISSGVRSATQLADLWRSELYMSCADTAADPKANAEIQRTYLKTHEGSWYYPDREYSSLFEKRYDLQRQRRMFVETEVAGKTPSIGYAYLTSLVSQNYFNTIFTTNFDDILNEAFYAYSTQRPIVCAHDSSINSITVTSKRPKVIKIHGDYLFDDLKSTVRETENLEQNMKAKFMEFAKDYGLVVVGYSGGDRSVMDALSSLLRNEEFLKNGIYWCLRAGSEVSEELRKLIWRDRVYFVEIDGFDELFAELFSIFNDGQILPSSATSIIHRPSDTTTRLLGSATAFPTTSAILKQAKEKLERQSKRTNLANLIFRPDNVESKRSLSSDGLEDDELAILAEIQNLASAGSHDQAIEAGRSHLRNPVGMNLRTRILRTIADEHRALNQLEEAIHVADELIKLQPRRASHQLLKARYQIKSADKLHCLDAAVATNEYSVDAHLEKARYYVNSCAHLYGEKRVAMVALAHESFDRGIECDPSWANICWLEKFNLWRDQELDKVIRNIERRKILNLLQKQNPQSSRVLAMRESLLEPEEKQATSDELLRDIADARERYSPDLDSFYDRLHLKVVGKLGDLKKLKAALNHAILSGEVIKDGDYAVEVSKLMLEKFDDEKEAQELLKQSLNYEFDPDVVYALVTSLANSNQIEEAESLLQKWGKRLSFQMRSELVVQILEMSDDIDAALLETRHRKQQAGMEYVPHENYLMLRKGEYKEVEILLRQRLESVNFTPEASVDLVNYELARKKLGHKPNAERLTAACRFGASDTRLSAGANAVLGRKAEMLADIKKILKEDHTFRYQAMKWPAFDEYRNDPDFQKIFIRT